MVAVPAMERVAMLFREVPRGWLLSLLWRGWPCCLAKGVVVVTAMERVAMLFREVPRGWLLSLLWRG